MEAYEKPQRSTGAASTPNRPLTMRTETNADLVSQEAKSGLYQSALPIFNGFGVPIVRNMATYSGKALTKTKSGFYKQMFMTLTNGELYIFSEVFSVKHQEVHVLTPGVFIEAHPPIELQGQDF